ncbi:LCP family protein [Lacticigenium naphthae]|uniref:LCP family protein n=1 Tax=Lacticigenium naphthae TaxID=515351 RepID=UPI0006864F43|nr:LCP family protein [Lacticigenium naphthae]
MPKKSKYTQTMWSWILIPLFIIILVSAIYVAIMLATAQKTVSNSYQEVERSTKVVVNPIEEPTSFLIMGIDNNESRQLPNTRADALIYVVINPQTSELNMVSIPRDTLTDIYSHGQIIGENRVNFAYQEGEEQATIETVENLLDVPIHYYITLNFDAFIDVVDAIGGVEMYVPITFSEKNTHNNPNPLKLVEGTQELTGEQTLALARTRKIDNDVKRGERQQLIIEAILKKMARLDSVPNYTKVIEAAGKNIKTDLTFNEIVSVSKVALSEDLSISTHTFAWYPIEVYGASMLQIEPDSLGDIQAILKESLEIRGTQDSSSSE